MLSDSLTKNISQASLLYHLHLGIHSLFSKICLSSYFSYINHLHHGHPGSSDVNHVECVFPFYPYSSRAVSKSRWMFLDLLISFFYPVPTPTSLRQASPPPPCTVPMAANLAPCFQLTFNLFYNEAKVIYSFPLHNFQFHLPFLCLQ